MIGNWERKGTAANGQNFRSDKKASVAVEFAIALPILILLLIGLIEFRSSFVVKQRTIIAATTMSSIVADTEEVSPALTRNLERIAAAILFPQSTSAIEVSVAVVKYNGLSLVIEWQDSSTDEPFPQETIDELMTDLLLTQETAVITEVKVIRDSIIGSTIPGLLEFSSRNVTYPDTELSYATDSD